MRVFITGAANGIGKATAEKLVEKGHKVIAYDIDSEGLDDLPEEVKTYEGDVRDRERLDEVVKKEIFEVLVNCAGFQEQGAVEDVPVESFEEHFETNFYGPLNAIKASLPMIKEREGRIVNVSSIAGKATARFLGAYSSSKYALEALSDALRLEMRGDPVDVVVIEPGAIRTGFNEKAEDALEKYLSDSSYADEYGKRMESDNNGASPEKAARVIVSAVEERNPRPRYTVTAQAFFIKKLKPILPATIQDFLASRF